MRLTLCLPLLATFMILIFSCKKENNPPIIENQSFEIFENSPDSSIVGTIVASDPDGNKLTFEIINAEELPFTVESSTNNLIVKSGYSLDFEKKSLYTFIVKVTDSDKSPLFNMATITVAIKNLNEIPLDGMIAYYPFNGNANDESINQFNGDLVGTVNTSDRKGNAISAFSFNGINNYIKLNPQVGNGIRSISLWFCLDEDINSNLAYPVALVHREGDFNNYSQFSIGFRPVVWPGNPGKLIFSNSSRSGYYNIDSNSSFWEKGKWYHVVAIIDPVKGMMLYVNNVRQMESATYNHATETSTINTILGSWELIPDRYLKGKIDEVIFYNRALTESEVNELYQE